MVDSKVKTSKIPLKESFFSFVIPAYNEEKNISLVYNKIINLMNPISNKWEIVFINDGSGDKTLNVLNEHSKKDKRVKFLSFSRNFGHQAALTAGMDNAKGDAIITLDCDLQDPPEVIAEMIERWKEGFDIVYARRRNRKDKFFKKYTALLYYKVLDKFSEIKIPRNVGDFRLVDRKVLDQLNGMKEKARYLRGMVAWLGFKYTFVDFDRPERVNGETNYTFTKMMRLAMDGILNFSLLPLKVGLMLGIMSIFAGLSFLIYMLIDTLLNGIEEYPLYKWLSVVSLIMIGFLFMLVWILGEYIGRIYDETKGRPPYVISQKGNF